MQKFVTDAQARELLLSVPVSPEAEVVPLSESFGRVLAEDIRASLMVPPFERSPFDGYAIRGEDTEGASKEHPVTLRITEELPAGKAPEFPVTAGTAAKILTGAPIPEGANATIKYELTTFTDTEVTIFSPVKPGSNLVPAGEDVKTGDLVAARGAVLSGSLMGELASQGVSEVRVYKIPVIAILNTGSELVDVGEPLPPAKIYNSNFYTISGYLRSFGVRPVYGGVVEDEPAAIAKRIGELLETSDMVITTGGASVGDYDWAVTASELMGADVLFWKTAMKPGGSMLASRKGNKVILGLSGSPGAAILGLLVVGPPYIRRLCGRADFELETLDVVMKEPFTKTSEKARFIRGRLVTEGGQACFSQIEGDANGIISSFERTNLIGVIPVEEQPAQAGQIIKAYKI